MTPTTNPAFSGPQVEARDLPEEQLAGQCRWEAFRASGPGGQKRNKTSSAVRYVHEPTGLSATASESRSQIENRRRALRRLRLRLALELRRSIDPADFAPPDWFTASLDKAGPLELPVRHEQFVPTVGLVLDVLAACGWSVSDAARLLGLSTAHLVRFLHKEEKVWEQVNRMRSAAGLHTLVVR